LPLENLQALAKKVVKVPKDFKLQRQVKKIMDDRASMAAGEIPLDWGMAETLAYATILSTGNKIRITGQDVRRGTFSHRHAVLYDQESNEAFIPLQQVQKDKFDFTIFDSLLSEEAVLAFEYGYATTAPNALVIWEAQFGDFANNAQSVIDLFIASGEAKWQRLSGLGMLLPHGWEGLGPEHSSARLERFLQLCANDNMQVVNPTTPAQYFHLLRCQALRKLRKPLVVMTPKSLLRHPKAVSTLDALAEGSFQEVIGDPEVEKPRRVLLCSGKIYYALDQRRQEREETKTAIVRLEQFFPFPAEALAEALGGYANAKEWFWVQEEPENMGGWQFVHRRIAERIDRPLSCIFRPASASPATGFPAIYKEQQEKVIGDAVGPKPKEGQVS
jgi:2-oxoglutarate dehydrogenase E1 component